MSVFRCPSQPFGIDRPKLFGGIESALRCPMRISSQKPKRSMDSLSLPIFGNFGRGLTHDEHAGAFLGCLLRCHVLIIVAKERALQVPGVLYG